MTSIEETLSIRESISFLVENFAKLECNINTLQTQYNSLMNDITILKKRIKKLDDRIDERFKKGDTYDTRQ